MDRETQKKRAEIYAGAPHEVLPDAPKIAPPVCRICGRPIYWRAFSKGGTWLHQGSVEVDTIHDVHPAEPKPDWAQIRETALCDELNQRDGERREDRAKVVAGYDLAIHSNPDARAWARLFVETIEEVAKRDAESPNISDVHRHIHALVSDESYMLTWFANAMMAMHDHQERKRKPETPARIDLCEVPGCGRPEVGGRMHICHEHAVARAEGEAAERISNALSLFQDKTPVAGHVAGIPVAARYRTLEPGEPIWQGDEFSVNDGADWRTLPANEELGLKERTDVLYRRRVAEPKMIRMEIAGASARISAEAAHDPGFLAAMGEMIHRAKEAMPRTADASHDAFGCYAPILPWWKRLARRIFPSKAPELPKAPGQWLDVIHLNMETEFLLADRLRLLFSGRVQTRAYIVTENTAGATMSSAVAFPLAPKRFYGSGDHAAFLKRFMAIGSPESAGEEMDTRTDQARALHRVIRALHDGHCPSCGFLFDSSLAPNANGESCPACHFAITREEMAAAVEQFRPIMAKSLAVFQEWRQARAAAVTAMPPSRPLGRGYECDQCGAVKHGNAAPFVTLIGVSPRSGAGIMVPANCREWSFCGETCFWRWSDAQAVRAGVVAELAPVSPLAMSADIYG